MCFGFCVDSERKLRANCDVKFSFLMITNHVNCALVRCFWLTLNWNTFPSQIPPTPPNDYLWRIQKIKNQVLIAISSSVLWNDYERSLGHTKKNQNKKILHELLWTKGLSFDWTIRTETDEKWGKRKHLSYKLDSYWTLDTNLTLICVDLEAG